MGYKETDEIIVQIGSHKVRAGCFFRANVVSQSCRIEGRRDKTEGRVAGAWIEELTPSGHPKGLSPSPVHLGGGAIVIGDGVERHVLGIGYSGLEFGHDMVDPLFQEGPGCGEVGVCGRHRIDGWVVCGHFVKSDGNLGQREIVVWERKRRVRCCGLEVTEWPLMGSACPTPRGRVCAVKTAL